MTSNITKFMFVIVIPCFLFIVSGCGTGNTGHPHIYHACWSPDQSYIVQSSDSKGRTCLFIGDGGGIYFYQELHLRWCSVDEVNKQKDVRLKSTWFSNSLMSAPLIYFSQDSTKVALSLSGKITVIELSSGKKFTLKPDLWHPAEWVSVCESRPMEISDTQCKLQRDELPDGFTTGIVSPDGKRTALIDYDGRVVIENKNLKVKP